MAKKLLPREKEYLKTALIDSSLFNIVKKKLEEDEESAGSNPNLNRPVWEPAYGAFLIKE